MLELIAEIINKSKRASKAEAEVLLKQYRDGEIDGTTFFHKVNTLDARYCNEAYHTMQEERKSNSNTGNLDGVINTANKSSTP